MKRYRFDDYAGKIFDNYTNKVVANINKKEFPEFFQSPIAINDSCYHYVRRLNKEYDAYNHLICSFLHDELTIAAENKQIDDEDILYSILPF